MPPPYLETSRATPVAELDDWKGVDCFIPALKIADVVAARIYYRGST